MLSHFPYLFFGRRDECGSKDERSDCQVGVAFTWSWKDRGDGRDWRHVGVCDARVFRKLHFRHLKYFHIFHALSAFPVAVHRVLFPFLSCHVKLRTRKGPFKIGTLGVLKRCRIRLIPSFVTL